MPTTQFVPVNLAAMTVAFSLWLVGLHDSVASAIQNQKPLCGKCPRLHPLGCNRWSGLYPVYGASWSGKKTHAGCLWHITVTPALQKTFLAAYRTLAIGNTPADTLVKQTASDKKCVSFLELSIIGNIGVAEVVLDPEVFVYHAKRNCC